MNEKTQSQLPPLPSSGDAEFWGEGETYLSQNRDVSSVCRVHTKERWKECTEYIDNKDSSISCRVCGWGTPIAGYYRVLYGKVIDLRTLNS